MISEKIAHIIRKTYRNRGADKRTRKKTSRLFFSMPQKRPVVFPISWEMYKRILNIKK